MTSNFQGNKCTLGQGKVMIVHFSCVCRHFDFLANIFSKQMVSLSIENCAYVECVCRVHMYFIAIGQKGPSKVTVKQSEESISPMPEKVVIQAIPAATKSKTKQAEKPNVEKVAVDSAPKKKEVTKKPLDNVKKVMVDASTVKRGGKPGMKHKPQSNVVAGKFLKMIHRYT